MHLEEGVQFLGAVPRDQVLRLVVQIFGKAQFKLEVLDALVSEYLRERVLVVGPLLEIVLDVDLQILLELEGRGVREEERVFEK